MKKIINGLLILMMMVSLFAGCSNKESQSATTTVSGESKSSQSSSSGSSEQASQSQESGGKTIKPEQLISKDDVSKLIGEAVKAGIEDEYKELGLSSCYYAPENAQSKKYLQISILQKEEKKEGQSGGAESSGKPKESSSQSQSAQSGESGGSGGGEMSPKKLYEGLKKIFSDANAAVTGHIGDDIFVSGKSITVLSGEYCIIISAGSEDPAAVEKTLKDAAEMAVGNLKRIQGK